SAREAGLTVAIPATGAGSYDSSDAKKDAEGPVMGALRACTAAVNARQARVRSGSIATLRPGQDPPIPSSTDPSSRDCAGSASAGLRVCSSHSAGGVYEAGVRRDRGGAGAGAAVLRSLEASPTRRQPGASDQGLQEGAQRGRGARGGEEAPAGTAIEEGGRSVLQHGWMSLRLQLVLLFTAVLAATLLVAAALGLRIAQRSVEDEIRKRTVELANATTLALRHAGNG